MAPCSVDVGGQTVQLSLTFGASVSLTLNTGSPLAGFQILHYILFVSPRNLTAMKPWGPEAICGHAEASFAFSESAWSFLAPDLDVEDSQLATGGLQFDPNLGLF